MGNQAGKPQKADSGKSRTKKGGATSPVLVWGEGTSGQLGLGAQSTSRPSPTPVPFFTQVPNMESISCGPEHAAFISTGGTAFMTGTGSLYRLGLGNDNNCLTPTVNEFTQTNPVTAAACGSTFSLFLTKKGIVYSCGSAKKGALGQGATTTAKLPKRVNRLNKVTHVACGLNHCAALNEYGNVFTWGDPSLGALGHGELDYNTKLKGCQDLPKMIESSYVSRTKFIDIACGDYHTAILSEHGEVSCCGQGENGQLGYGGKQEHFFPRRIEIIEEKEGQTEEESRNGKKIQGIQLFCGPSSTAIISVDGEVYFWGDGQLFPSVIRVPEKAVHIAPHPCNGMILCDNNSVYSYDTEELMLSDDLVASLVVWKAPPIRFLASGPSYFAVLIGEAIPDLSGVKQLVLSSASVSKRQEQDVAARNELFARTEKPKRRVLDEDVETDTSLDKMKQELFSCSKKSGKVPKQLETKKETPTPTASLPAGASSPIIASGEDVDLEEFKKQLLGNSSSHFPDNTTSVPSPLVEEEEEEEEEFVDELPINCTLYQAPSLVPNNNLSDLPEPEVLKGSDFLEDDDLL